MRFFSHFSITDFSNAYLLGPDKQGDAVLIDPGVFDELLLKLVENHKFYVRYVLISHAHKGHINGIKTLLKIYDAQLFCFNHTTLGFPCHRIKGGDHLQLGEFDIEVIETPGHSWDSLSFKIDSFVFTGDALSSGLVGKTETDYEQSLLLSSLRNLLSGLDDNTMIFPGHGPPTTAGIERRFNSFLKDEP